MAAYEGVLLELERQELELTPPNVGIYVKLFACYLVQDRLYDAKFLWRRIPKNFKAENDEIEHLNRLLRALLCNNHLDFLKLLKREWSEDIKTMMDDLLSTYILQVTH